MEVQIVFHEIQFREAALRFLRFLLTKDAHRTDDRLWPTFENPVPGRIIRNRAALRDDRQRRRLGLPFPQQRASIAKLDRRMPRALMQGDTAACGELAEPVDFRLALILLHKRYRLHDRRWHRHSSEAPQVHLAHQLAPEGMFGKVDGKSGTSPWSWRARGLNIALGQVVGGRLRYYDSLR